MSYGKVYNQNHRSEIHYNLSPLLPADKSLWPKDGDIVTHKQIVSSVSFFESARSTQGDFYIEVWLSRDKILDLAEHIKRIENIEVETVYDNIPF